MHVNESKEFVIMNVSGDEYNSITTWLKGQQKVSAASIQRQFGFSYNKSHQLLNRFVEDELLLPGATKTTWIVRRLDDK